MAGIFLMLRGETAAFLQESRYKFSWFFLFYPTLIGKSLQPSLLKDPLCTIFVPCLSDLQHMSTLRLLVYVGILLLPLGLWAQQPVPGRPERLPVDTTQTSSDSARKRVRILNADVLSFQVQNDTAIQKLIGNVRLVQDSTYFFCDSALFLDTENKLKAYGRVRIEMPDEVSLLARRLDYDGNTRIARLYRDILLSDPESKLTTDTLVYYRRDEFGYYQGGGKLVNDSTVLTSEIGYYYPNRHLAYFRDSVTLVHPDYTLTTDTLAYDTEHKIAQFVTRTLIDSKDGEIETTKGTYHTETSKVSLFQRSVVRDSSFTLTADTLYYVNDDNLGMAIGRVRIQQDDSTLELRGNYGQFNRQTDESWLTRRASAIQRMEDDTLYLLADTLYSLKDTQYIDMQAPPEPAEGVSDSIPGDSLASVLSDSLLAGEPDSLLAPPLTDSLMSGDSSMVMVSSDSVQSDSLLIGDTTQIDTASADSGKLVQGPMEMGPPTLTQFEKRLDTVIQQIFRGSPNVRIYMNQMQGRADSIVYYYEDSVMQMFKGPVLWADDNQLNGGQIGLWMRNEQADSMAVTDGAFMMSEADTVGFNQLKGSAMQVKFVNNNIYRIRLTGNSESIFYVEEQQDSAAMADGAPKNYQGMNKALSNGMDIYFADDEVNRIVFKSRPEGTFSPMFEVIFQNNLLDGMSWRGGDRPTKPFWLMPPPPIVPISLQEIVPLAGMVNPSAISPGEMPVPLAREE